MRRGKLHISWKIMLQKKFFSLVHFSCLIVMGASGSDIFALRSDIQGEGHTAQVAVSGWIVNDALSIQFALYLDVSVVLHSCKTHSHHRWRVVYMSELPIVWIVLQVKKACRKKLELSQGFWRSLTPQVTLIGLPWPGKYPRIRFIRRRMHGLPWE